MVGFKATARASAYFTKLEWRRGCLWLGCVGLRVCVCVRGGHICVYG